MLRKTAVVAIMVGMLVVGLVGPSAVAKGPMTGAGVIAVTCSLPEFPTPGNTTSCSGTGAVVTAFVDDKGDPGVFVAAGGVSTKKVSYFEPCTAGEPLTGFATGSVEGQGTWLAAKNGTGHPAHIWIPFNWQRVGVVAVVTTGKLSGKGNKTITDKTNGQTATDAVGDVAVGILVPLGVPGNCTTPAPLDVLVPAIDIEIA